MKIQTEKPATYTTTASQDDAIIARALDILRARHAAGTTLSNPRDVINYLQLQLRGLEHEVFGVITLDAHHHVISMTELSRGTIDGASVYPREVAKHCLSDNAHRVIFYHNHPSGLAEPSTADRQITEKLVNALALLDIGVLDHLIIGDGSYSFADNGQI